MSNPIDLSKNVNLTSLTLENNSLKDIDISTNLDDFEIAFWNDNSTTLWWDDLYTFINDEINNHIVDSWSNDIQLTGWRAFDPNCPIDDIQIWDQTWAGCNSTLGDWFEWGKQDNGNDIRGRVSIDLANDDCLTSSNYPNGLMVSAQSSSTTISSTAASSGFYQLFPKIGEYETKITKEYIKK